MVESNSGGMSFAERYASKKTNFSSESLKKTPPQPNQTQQNSSLSEAAQKNLKSIDPQKKMQADLIYLVKGIDAGRNAWYYVLVDRLKVQLFLKDLNNDIIHLENYGKVLFSAYGEEPPSDITNQLKEEYGIVN